MARIGLDLRFWRTSTAGLGRYSRNLLSELLKLDVSNDYTAIITPDDEPEFNLEAGNLTKQVVPIEHFSYSEQLRLPGILEQQKFDLLHFANFNHPIMYRRRFVVTVHDLIMHLFPTGSQQNSFLRQSAYRLIMNDCRRAAMIIVPSKSTKNDLIKMLKMPSDKIIVTPEGAEGNFKIAAPDSIKSLRARLQLPERYLLFVSRWERYKGLPALLEAYQLLRQEFPDLGLVITGKPDKQNPEISALVKSYQIENKLIVTPGFVGDEDLSILYSGASVYVHPSWYEGFGIMILEAFATGVPVVTSNVSSLPEVVGDAGMLVDPQSSVDIASKIRQILVDPSLASSLRCKGLDRVRQYSWKKMAELTLDIYRKAIGLNA